MLYFKNSGGEVFAYETAEFKDKYGEGNLVPLNEDETSIHLAANTNTEDPSLTERLWRDSELVHADIELYKVQDSGPKAKGSVSEWREYRRKLRDYPESEGFPNKESRPVAPDAA